jgi:PQQ-dependent catabolism-associated CXXCW motif protein
MKVLMRTFFLFFLMTIALGAHAMKVEVHGDTAYASGPVEDDIAKFQEALAKPGVTRVVLVNSVGGDLWTGMRVGRLIEDKGLNTVIAGYCISSCSIMFMGGKERSFSDAFRPAMTYIGIHGAHNKDTGTVNAQLNPQIYAFFKSRMAERFNAEVMNKAFYDMQDAGALLKVFDAARTPIRVTHHCKSTQIARKDCSELKEIDALNLGVVTTNTLTKLELPISYKEIPTLMGQELNIPFTDSANYFKNMAEEKCLSILCRNLVYNLINGKEHKALAMPIGSELGLGTAINQDTTTNAFVVSIYNCNHVKEKPARLCETLTVNGFDVRSFYTAGMASHALALTKLNSPPDKYYGSEEYGGGMTRANAMRVQTVHDMTPQKFDGIKTYGTQELAMALKSEQAPVLIDVWAGVNDAIPSAMTLLSGGLAFDDATVDLAYEKRFSGLLKLLSPDLQKPIVFYCQSRNCWLSANAAMRAKKLGYTQVGWYRGGMESWKAANLPLANVVLRAVVN